MGVYKQLLLGDGMLKKVKQLGFTIIELVVVIVILGILAAFAVPRFVDLAGDAREAAVQGLEGSVRAASTLAHSKFLAQGSTGTVDMEGSTITMVNGYPALTDIDNTLVDFSGFTYVPTDGDFTKDGAATPASCKVTYAAAVSTSAPPVISSTTSAC